MDGGRDAKREERNRVVSEAIADIRAVMVSGPSLENLNRGKARLIALAARQDLFTFEDFPLPADDGMECSYLIHEGEEGSCALCVNAGAPHQYSAPHDHGDARANIAGVRGRERHRLYLRGPSDQSGAGPLADVGGLDVEW